MPARQSCLLAARLRRVPDTANIPEQTDPNRQVRLVEVPVHADGQRLDNFLLTQLKGVPKSHVYRLIRKGEVRVNKKRAQADTRLKSADLVRVPPVMVAVREAVQPPGEALRALLRDAILFENQDILVVNKPQGLAVHLGSGLQTGLIEALRWMRAQEEGTENAYLELVHRIDKDTSGCVLIAKNSLILKALQKEFKVKNITKRYQMIVHGRWPATLLTIDAPLQRRDIENNEKIVTVDPAGKASVTHFRLLEDLGSVSLVEASPLTGRTHQIRVHAQHAGHPIVGDPKYTLAQPDALDRQYQLCLHAASIAFRMPDGEAVEVHAPLQENMSRLLESLRRQPRRRS